MHDATHALGPCGHNHAWAKGTPYPPKGTDPAEIYANYRWVVTMVGSGGYCSPRHRMPFTTRAARHVVQHILNPR